MECIDHTIQTGGRWDNRWHIVPLGDMHFGTIHFDKDKFLGFVEYIRKSKNVRWIGMGDYCEWICMNDKRFDVDNIHVDIRDSIGDLVQAQQTWMIRHLRPIADKCIGLHMGNHEDTLRRVGERDVYGNLCSELRVPRLGYSAFVNIHFRRQARCGKSVTIFSTHGNGYSRAPGGKINTVVKLAESFSADVYLMGHMHEVVSLTKDLLESVKANRNEHSRVRPKKRIFAVTGSFYQTYKEGHTSYGERALYSPARTGTVKILMEPWERSYQRSSGDARSSEDAVHLHVSE